MVTSLLPIPACLIGKGEAKTPPTLGNHHVSSDATIQNGNSTPHASMPWFPNLLMASRTLDIKTWCTGPCFVPCPQSIRGPRTMNLSPCSQWTFGQHGVPSTNRWSRLKKVGPQTSRSKVSPSHGSEWIKQVPRNLPASRSRSTPGLLTRIQHTGMPVKQRAQHP